MVRATTVLAAGLALFAFGGACDGGGGSVDGDGGPTMVDAGPGADADTDCETVPQSGCAPGDKCAFVLDDAASGSGIEACAPSGPVAIGNPCVPPQQEGQADNCVIGAHCYLGVCRQMCDGRLVGCDEESSCVEFARFEFDMCLPKCDLLEQDCPEAQSGEPQGCYLTPNGPVCAAVVGGTGRPPGTSCEFENECRAGAGCYAIGNIPSTCYAYCDAARYGGGNDPERCAPTDICSAITQTIGICF